MLRNVQATIDRHRLLAPGDHVLVGVSGGADSVALAYALHYFSKKYRLRLTIAHLHHGIRGRAADKDADFVRKLAGKLKWPFIMDRVDVPGLARSKRISMEMAAREARYAFFADAARTIGASAVATAHTADDQVETVLLRFLRGAGSRGLGGMQYRSKSHGLTIIRPMLDVTHKEAVTFLRRHRRAWREDASNKDIDILRNRIRHKALPFLESQFNPQVRGAILRTAEVLREENTWLNALAKKLLAQCAGKTGRAVLDVSRLQKQPRAARRRMLLLWLMSAGLDPEEITFDVIERLDRMAQSPRGSASMVIAGSWHALRRYQEMSLRKGTSTSTKTFRRRLIVPGETRLADEGLCVGTTWGKGIVKPQRSRVGEMPATATITREAIGKAPLYVRSWRAGDRIKPLGMKGTLKIQNLFTDQKIPRDERLGIPLVECRGEIVWIPGYRVARGWEVPGPRAPSLHISVERK